MKKLAIAVHGGASPNSDFIRNHQVEIEKGLASAAKKGHAILLKGGSALDAVQEAICCLEDDPLFNAGKGSALNAAGQVEMDASIMDGAYLKAGAVSMVRLIKNPIRLAYRVMAETNHVLLSGYGAERLAQQYKEITQPEDYFITANQFEEYQRLAQQESLQRQLIKPKHGTVGAVALDSYSNLAAGTSTGGTSNCLPGRIGDSCQIGAGCYANNQSCAVSGTGEGEYLIRKVVAHTIAMMMEFGMSLAQACHHVVHERAPDVVGEIGVIAVSHDGTISHAFNTEIMKRAWINQYGELTVEI